MFVVPVGLSVVAVALWFVANRRFDRSGPTWWRRVLSMLISLSILAAVYLVTASVTGHASIVMMPVGVIAAALVDIAITEAFRRRTGVH